MLGGLIVWAAHFFLLYAFASIFPGTQLARRLTVLATAIALAGDLLIIRHAAAAGREGGGDSFDRWTRRFARAGALLSLIAVLWQGLPALT